MIMAENAQFRIATSKAFAPPPENIKKVRADGFLGNEGDISDRYIWDTDGNLLGRADQAIAENDGSYCIIFNKMNDAMGDKFCLNSNYILVGIEVS